MEPNIAMDARQRCSGMGSPWKVRAARPWGCGHSRASGKDLPHPAAPCSPQERLSSSPKLSKVPSATSVNLPRGQASFQGRRGQFFRAAKEKRSKVRMKYEPVRRACPPGRVGESGRAVPPSSRSPASCRWPRPGVPPHASCGRQKEAAIRKLAQISEDPKGF